MSGVIFGILFFANIPLDFIVRSIFESQKAELIILYFNYAIGFFAFLTMVIGLLMLITGTPIPT